MILTGTLARAVYLIPTILQLFKFTFQGQLNMTVPVDREDPNLTKNAGCRGVLILTVKASDNGTQKLSDTARV